MIALEQDAGAVLRCAAEALDAVCPQAPDLRATRDAVWLRVPPLAPGRIAPFRWASMSPAMQAAVISGGAMAVLGMLTWGARRSPLAVPAAP